MVANFGRNLLGALAREPGEPAPVPQAARDKARRLLADYHEHLEHKLCGSLNDKDLWIAEAAELLERIAGES